LRFPSPNASFAVADGVRSPLKAAPSFVLLTLCRERGFVLPKGAMIGDSVSTVQIGSVTITPIRSGEFVGPEIVVDGRAILGGRKPDDDDEPGRLN
jgi:hypothetical protein